MLDAEAGAVLDAAVAALSPEQRAVFVLRAVEEMSYEEIAGALGISPGTVMSRLFRARATLREAIEQDQREAGSPADDSGGGDGGSRGGRSGIQEPDVGEL